MKLHVLTRTPVLTRAGFEVKSAGVSLKNKAFAQSVAALCDNQTPLY